MIFSKGFNKLSLKLNDSISLKKSTFLFLFFVSLCESQAQKLTSYTQVLSETLTSNQEIMRRDPSDIIKVDGTYFVWYSKRYAADGAGKFPGDASLAHGYHADVWFATSQDGVKWVEQGLSIPKGSKGAWDEQSAFTPNILVWKDKYYLYYTGCPKPFVNGGNQVTKTAIGVAESLTPYGPWTKLADPILECSSDFKVFDSMRIDDACLVVMDDTINMYYKGRQWNNTPGNTKLGLATATNPFGPFKKHEQNPLINGGHEVMAWPLGKGIMAMVNIGPVGLQKTLQFASDGINFKTVSDFNSCPHGAGFYRPEAFTNSKKGKMPEWGIEIFTSKGALPGLGRVDMNWENIFKE